MTVAVGFNPRFAASHDESRRGATPETWLPLGTRPHQASRRDATFISSLEPWVETLVFIHISRISDYHLGRGATS